MEHPHNSEVSSLSMSCVGIHNHNLVAGNAMRQTAQDARLQQMRELNSRSQQQPSQQVVLGAFGEAAPHHAGLDSAFQEVDEGDPGTATLDSRKTRKDFTSAETSVKTFVKDRLFPCMKFITNEENGSLDYNETEKNSICYQLLHHSQMLNNNGRREFWHKSVRLICDEVRQRRNTCQTEAKKAWMCEWHKRNCSFLN